MEILQVLENPFTENYPMGLINGYSGHYKGFDCQFNFIFLQNQTRLIATRNTFSLKRTPFLKKVSTFQGNTVRIQLIKTVISTYLGAYLRVRELQFSIFLVRIEPFVSSMFNLLVLLNSFI